MLEAGTKIATSTIDAMKSQPLALALIVINVLFLATGAWVFHVVGDAIRTDRELRNVLLAQMTDHCIVQRESPQ